MDERAEVGLLSRNIVIEGEVQDECSPINQKERTACERFGRDTYGGHVMVSAWTLVSV